MQRAKSTTIKRENQSSETDGPIHGHLNYDKSGSGEQYRKTIFLINGAELIGSTCGK